jgi:hypothetical protein
MNHDLSKLEHHLETLNKRVSELQSIGLSKELLLIIHRPGWTTPAEFVLVGNAVESLTHSIEGQILAVAECSPSVSSLGRCHVALRQEIAAQAVGDLAGVNAIIFLLGGCDRSQHQRVRYFDLCRMRMEMIVDPAGKNRCFHSHRPGLRKGFSSSRPARSGFPQACLPGELDHSRP